MNLHVELDGDEIFVTRPGTDMMRGYRKSPQPDSRSHPKLGRAHRLVT